MVRLSARLGCHVGETSQSYTRDWQSSDNQITAEMEGKRSHRARGGSFAKLFNDRRHILTLIIISEAYLRPRPRSSSCG